VEDVGRWELKQLLHDPLLMCVSDVPFVCSQYIHYFMQPNQVLHHKISQGWNSFLYSLEGKISVGSSSKWIEAHNTITLTNTPDSDGITIRTGAEAAQFVLLAGKPIGEPVVQHGPFVMNDREGIMQAIRDFQEGKNGFERAPGWRSEIGRPITDYMGDHDDDWGGRLPLKLPPKGSLLHEDTHIYFFRLQLIFSSFF
jgi:hypothetical protein